MRVKRDNSFFFLELHTFTNFVQLTRKVESHLAFFMASAMTPTSQPTTRLTAPSVAALLNLLISVDKLSPEEIQSRYVNVSRSPFKRTLNASMRVPSLLQTHSTKAAQTPESDFARCLVGKRKQPKTTTLDRQLVTNSIEQRKYALPTPALPSQAARLAAQVAQK